MNVRWLTQQFMQEDIGNNHNSLIQQLYGKGEK